MESKEEIEFKKALVTIDIVCCITMYCFAKLKLSDLEIESVFEVCSTRLIEQGFEQGIIDEVILPLIKVSKELNGKDKD